jgi:hypothetical protein
MQDIVQAVHATGYSDQFARLVGAVAVVVPLCIAILCFKSQPHYGGLKNGSYR